MFVSPFADFLYPPPPLYLPHNTMVILGSPRIPRRGISVARSIAQRSDALREIGPTDLRISCIHRLSCILRRWIQEIRKSGGPISRSASLRCATLRATRIPLRGMRGDPNITIVLCGRYRGGGGYRKSANGETNIDISIFKYRYINMSTMYRFILI